MHYATLVLVNRDDFGTEGALEDAVTAVIGESADWWDWWQIGGRYTGRLDGFDPETAPENIEACPVCHGTGKRDDELGREFRERNPDYTCNGCNGNGTRAKWPTQWTRHAGDVMPGSMLTDEQVAKFYHVAIAGYGLFSAERFVYRPWCEDPDKRWQTVEGDLPPAAWLREVAEKENLIAVVVDVHN